MPESDHTELSNIIRERVGQYVFEARSLKEKRKERSVRQGANKFFFIESKLSFRQLFKLGLKTVGLLDRGRRNALDLHVRRNECWLTNLPLVFDGYRILHLSDLHLDANDGLTDALAKRVADLEYDICVISGDFRARSFGPIKACIAKLSKLRPSIKTDVFATLGNHDSIRMVPELERLDIRLLMNESVSIERGGQKVALVGVDDPHFFQSDDLVKACSTVPENVPMVLIVHSPELIDQASKLGIGLYLCGHTHGGQICLPGGLPIISNSRSSRRYSSGAWKFRDMLGYTSRGSGVSIVDVRFNCPPEVTLHTLRAT